MIKYQAQYWTREKIRPVEVEKETPAFVFINGRRHSKKAADHGVFDTFEDAKQFLMDIAKDELDSIKARVDHARSKLEHIQQLKPVNNTKE